MHVKYTRPQAKVALPKAERATLLEEYVRHYQALAADDVQHLNRKIPRAVFEELLDDIGVRLLAEAVRVAREPGPVRVFLDENPLPGRWRDLLPDEFRAFSLILNALKQWVVAESAATDRYILGGRARDELRAASSACLVTGQALGSGAELHHPVRDGRPPLLLSKEGHSAIEQQTSSDVGDTDPASASLWRVRMAMNRSWAALRRGCLDLLDRQVEHSSPATAAQARSFARRAGRESGLSFNEILDWLDVHGL